MIPSLDTTHAILLVVTTALVAGCPADDVSSNDDSSTSSSTDTSGPTASSTGPLPGSTSTETESDTTSSDDTSTGGGTAGSTSSVDTSSGADSSSGGDASSTGVSSSSTGPEEVVCGDNVTAGDEECDDANDDNLDGCLEGCILARSCQQILATIPAAVDGVYAVDPDDMGAFPVFCDMTTDGGGWTLAARFANGDNTDNWMLNDGGWWFDVEAAQGNTVSTAQNADMLSGAFWRIDGAEFKVTRTDNADNAHLLITEGDCLGNDTFRGFITSLGYDNIGPWATDEVLATCDVALGNNYAETDGFAQAECEGGDIGAPNSISFWANWHDPANPVAADSAVMMIGGGGQACNRADHGIGITEENEASFTVTGEEFEGTFEADFANNGFGTPAATYGLNLFVR